MRVRRRMLGFVVGVILSLVWSVMPGSGQTTEPYFFPETQTRLTTELELGLIEVNIRMATSNIFVEFDSLERKFQAEGWLSTTAVDSVPESLLKEDLVSKVGLLKAILGRAIPEFKERGGRDLTVDFYLGFGEAPIIAIYQKDKFAFTVDFYKYLLGKGKQ